MISVVFMCPEFMLFNWPVLFVGFWLLVFLRYQMSFIFVIKEIRLMLWSLHWLNLSKMELWQNFWRVCELTPCICYVFTFHLLVIFNGYWCLTVVFCFNVWEQGLVTGLMSMNQLLKLKQIRCYVETTCKCFCEGFEWL